MNELVNVREAAIRLLTGARAGEVLNSGPAVDLVRPLPELAADLSRAVRAIKTAAIADDGMRVDYGALRSSPAYQHYRRELIPQLRRVNLAELHTRPEQIAFWVNLYNALILDGVIAYDVRRSVRERLAGLAFFRWAAYDIGGERFSADDIENGVLRANAGAPFVFGPQFTSADSRRRWVIDPLDPRIHFALNCASRSCPPIAVYDAEKLESQLVMASRSFIGTDVEVVEQQHLVRISSIFTWYRDDFGGAQGVLQFIRQHLPADDSRRLWMNAQSQVELEFKPYDWALNV